MVAEGVVVGLKAARWKRFMEVQRWEAFQDVVGELFIISDGEGEDGEESSNTRDSGSEEDREEEGERVGGYYEAGESVKDIVSVSDCGSEIDGIPS